MRARACSRDAALRNAPKGDLARCLAVAAAADLTISVTTTNHSHLHTMNTEQIVIYILIGAIAVAFSATVVRAGARASVERSS